MASGTVYPTAGKKGQPRRAVLNCLVLTAYTTLMVMLGSLPFREPASSGLLGWPSVVG